MYVGFFHYKYREDKSMITYRLFLFEVRGGEMKKCQQCTISLTLDKDVPFRYNYDGKGETADFGFPGFPGFPQDSLDSHGIPGFPMDPPGL